MPCACGDLMLSNKTRCFASIARPKLEWNSITRIRWETSEGSKTQENDRFKPNSRFSSFWPYDLMEKQLAACKLRWVGHRWFWPAGTGITLVWAPILVRNPIELDKSKCGIGDQVQSQRQRSLYWLAIAFHARFALKLHGDWHRRAFVLKNGDNSNKIYKMERENIF